MYANYVGTWPATRKAKYARGRCSLHSFYSRYITTVNHKRLKFKLSRKWNGRAGRLCWNRLTTAAWVTINEFHVYFKRGSSGLPFDVDVHDLKVNQSCHCHTWHKRNASGRCRRSNEWLLLPNRWRRKSVLGFNVLSTTQSHLRSIQYNTIQLYCLYVEKFAFWLVIYIKTFNTVNNKTSTTQ